jgi:hypothetical protein
VVRRRWTVLLSVGALLLLTAVAVRAATTLPQRIGDTPALEDFQPERVGAIEQQAWEAYYNREWPRLFTLMLDLIQGQFGLSPAQTVEAAKLGTRAQVVFAERGADDGQAEDLMRQFYALVREPAGGEYDPARAAQLEVGWWVVHRQRERYSDDSALIAALAALYAEVYRLPVEDARPAAEHRARAMAASDRWVDEGRVRNSPLLTIARDELVSCYTALHSALATRRIVQR